ncbi:MAG: hydantoinase B/oxoprolinase family protein [Acidimicrobiaceae bacterium]|nr:hydantoinase B/oxoprolinase family protein [Acidimicrobiaceae bacterium]
MKIDPILTEIISNRLLQIGYEGGLVLQRCAVSPGVVEGRDLGFNVSDADGRTVVYSTWMPRHGTTLSYMLQSCMNRFKDDIKPGDMYLVNDPHSGALHILDLAVMMPIHHNNELIAWVGNATHHVDVGAMTPGRAPLATDWHQEGIIFKPTRIVENGKIRDDIFNLFLDNVRMPRYQSLDLKAQISANFAAAEKILALVQRYGTQALHETFESSIQLAEAQARERISVLSPGVYEATEFLDYDKIYTIKATMTVNDNGLLFDFEGTDKEAKTFINCALPCAVANLHNILACQLFPDLTVNAGTFNLVDVKIPTGTVINCNPPAPCSGASTITGWRVQGITIALLTQALIDTPRKQYAMAEWGWGFTDVQWSGTDQIGRWYTVRGDASLHGGGARSNSNGIDVSNIAGSTNTALPSIESYEYRYPILYLSRGLLPDSDGAGQYRGGLAGYWSRCLYGVDSASDLSFYIGRDVGSRGFSGGEDGTSSKIIVKRGTDILVKIQGEVPLYEELGGIEEVLTQQPSALGLQINIGDAVYVRGMGGGGFGPPNLRDKEAILADIEDGLLSKQRAEATYGVTVD